MDKNCSTHKDRLLSQIRDAYGKVTYSERVHIEQYKYLDYFNKGIKYARIALSAISTTGFIGAIATNEIIAVWIGGVFSILLLVINLFYGNFNIAHDMGLHKKASDELWVIREKYVSLLTDYNSLSEAEIQKQRDELICATSDIYKEVPKTGNRVFSKAQKALKINGEQFFADDELNYLLPKHLRSTDKK